MAKSDTYGSFQPLSRAEWRAWLEQNHAAQPGIWFVYNKKFSGLSRVEYDEAVEEALCFGWIDSKPGRVDEVRASLLFTPRKSKSGWSQTNKVRLEKLMAAGLMHPAGLAKVQAAQADGSWTLLDGSESLEMPADLLAALEALPTARQHFEAFPPGVRKAILQWIVQAKTSATRQKRIGETATLAQQNIRANQWTGPKTP